MTARLAERYVSEWSDLFVGTTPPRKDDKEAIEDLALKLENDAWDFGLDRKEFLEAVGGDSYEFVLSEVEKT